MFPLSEHQSPHTNNPIVDNDFHQTHAIFSMLETLEVEDLDKPLMNGHQLNGSHSPIANGTH